VSEQRFDHREGSRQRTVRIEEFTLSSWCQKITFLPSTHKSGIVARSVVFANMSKSTSSVDHHGGTDNSNSAGNASLSPRRSYRLTSQTAGMSLTLL
jgi:hypothetical protein